MKILSRNGSFDTICRRIFVGRQGDFYENIRLYLSKNQRSMTAKRQSKVLRVSLRLNKSRKERGKPHMVCIMEQMQAFIEKARNDKDLMAKLDELGAAGASAEEIVALAAEYGFSIMAEEYWAACVAAGTRKCKNGELAEEELEVVAGGGTQNRYDPKVCCNYTKVEYRCVGFLAMTYCDHYRIHYRRHAIDHLVADRHICQMGIYDYYVED